MKTLTIPDELLPELLLANGEATNVIGPLGGLIGRFTPTPKPSPATDSTEQTPVEAKTEPTII